ncbi:MAG: hypothetical protein ACOCVF_00390 [bacterium]
MFIENKILRTCLRNLRLLNEGSGDDILKRAINNNEYIYIYYEGDGIVSKGYRTVLPLVLGTSKAGDYNLIRAWQISGVSDSKKRYSNDKGKQEFGWRLFRVDRMTSILPTGRKMNYKRIPPSFDKDAYNPNDSQMGSILLAAPPFTKGNVNLRGTDSIDEPDQIEKQVNVNQFDAQGDRFRQFFKASEKKRDIIKSDVEELYRLNRIYRKKSPQKTIVITNEKGDFVLRDIREKDKLPKESIVGTLDDLYQEYVKPTTSMSDDFFKQRKSELIKK